MSYQQEYSKTQNNMIVISLIIDVLYLVVKWGFIVELLL